MKLLKIGAVVLFGGLLLTGCGAEEEKEAATNNTISCTFSQESPKEENSVKIEYDGDTITSADMSFNFVGGFEQSHVDAVCNSYELYEGLDCTGTYNEEENNQTYEIKIDNDASTKEYLNISHNIEGATKDELKAAFEEKNYVCE